MTRPGENEPLWLPQAAGDDVEEAILAAAKRSCAEAERVAAHWAASGQLYEAARCLELASQERLGLRLDADRALLGPEAEAFGAFHAWVSLLVRAGRYYARSGRRRTAQSTYARARLFVEEALRTVTAPPAIDAPNLACLGAAFELAGHCCAAELEREGLTYYRAAERYWRASARLRPESVMRWRRHPVGRTLAHCLADAADLPPETYWRAEASADFEERLAAARRLYA